MEISGLKRDIILPVLAAFSVNACTVEQGPSQDERMAAALETLDQGANQLALSFEEAVKRAMETGKTYSEHGNPNSGVLLVDGDKSFGCVDSTDAVGKICEVAAYEISPSDPSGLILDRNQSTLLYVADGSPDIQVVSRDGADKPQDVSTMIITDKNCGIHSSKNGINSSEGSTTPSLIKECVALRNGLIQRLGEFVKKAASVKAKP